MRSQCHQSTLPSGLHQATLNKIQNLKKVEESDYSYTTSIVIIKGGHYLECSRTARLEELHYLTRAGWLAKDKHHRMLIRTKIGYGNILFLLFYSIKTPGESW